MTIWEYHRERVPFTQDADDAVLTALGKKGWELVEVYESDFPPFEADNAPKGRVFLFKRPIP
jgi:hypothetical protein